MKRWTQEEVTFLALNYPNKGRSYCANALNRTEAQIRSKVSREKIYQDYDSDFFKEWQERAAKSKIGRKASEEERNRRSTKAIADFASGKRKVKRSTRSRMSVAMKKRIALEGHSRGFKGKRHSDETKQKFSIIVKQRWANMTDEQKSSKTLKMLKTKHERGSLNPMRNGVTWKAAWHLIGGKKNYYRSRWESNYARYLEFLKAKGDIKDWFHEPDVFWFDGVKRGCVSYLPDFKIINNDDSIEYHEVKGWMDDKSLTKIKRMSKYHPAVKLKVIATKQYNELLCKLGKVIPGWE